MERYLGIDPHRDSCTLSLVSAQGKKAKQRVAYFLSESSVYRILKAYDRITSPAYVLLFASERFSQPSRRVNGLL